MSREYLYVEKEGAIATLYINRPDKRNAFNYDMWHALPGLLDDVERDDKMKVLVLRGVDDSAFVAGADIAEFTTLRATDEGERKYNEAVIEAEAALSRFSKPTIAMVQKYCIGGGCILALACDLKFSSETGIFGITPAKLGIIYTFSGTKNLVDLVGPARAKDMLYSGRELGAQEAYQYGLIDRIYSSEEIVEKTYAYAQLLTTRAQKTIKGAKIIIKEVMNGATKETAEISELVSGSYASTDYKEGVKAFLEKRQPQFSEV
ncbi:enoyl-CoA hydratase-related protein [Ammoniphilus sp. YIM 78166]|uniref:enoyl-CoA hydratase-related protein n=1 Tax=Ammoniphilus sp. YIM 78166 TaxID=1644106 RepID=UPI00106F16E9|nr:enoyl-CoA hydratase-related protein [Ammoniphilus sp. YIM 78166]